jgi:hypothetical protein
MHVQILGAECPWLLWLRMRWLDRAGIACVHVDACCLGMTGGECKVPGTCSCMSRLCCVSVCQLVVISKQAELEGVHSVLEYCPALWFSHIRQYRECGCAVPSLIFPDCYSMKLV